MQTRSMLLNFIVSKQIYKNKSVITIFKYINDFFKKISDLNRDFNNADLNRPTLEGANIGLLT